jgi:transposase
MRKKRFSVEQMIGVLKQAEVGVPVAEVIRKAGISEQTFYRWKAKYAGLEVELRRVVDALLYVVKTGCQWRQLPVNFPQWPSVHQQFRAWRDDGTWERVGQTLREQGRTAHRRKATPTVAILDSQSAKTALKGAARLRRRQEDEGPQAAHRGRHRRQPAGTRGAFGWHPGPGGGPRRAVAVILSVRHHHHRLRRRRLIGFQSLLVTGQT